MPASTSAHQGGSLPEQRMRLDVRGVVQLAVVEASDRNSERVEAEHLLLALLFDRSNPAAAILRGEGLDYDGLTRALVGERTASLRAAGVEPVPAERLATSGRRGRPRFATSFKQALQAGHRLAPTQRNHTMRSEDVAIGVLAAELGTVPRALALAGFDRRALLAALRAKAA